jgi:tetraacyldisaccharide 4'-kinase
MTDRPTRLPTLLTKPMSWIYALGAAHKARGFDAGRGVVQLDRPVISVGNLSAGGTGKSPMVHHIVRTLLDHGHNPAIAMRGYKAAPGTLGDEAMEHRDRFADVPIVAQPDRVSGLRELFATDAGKQVDSVVLDDGFQHRRIARDLDLVLIDASRPPAHDALLPHGYLREPIAALSRADACVLMHTEMVDAEACDRLDQWVESVTSNAPIARTRHAWSTLDVTEDGERRAEPIAWINGRRLVLLCGIGNPHALQQQVESHGGQILRSIVLNDHESMSETQFRSLAREIRKIQPEALLMTRKDAVKMGKQIESISCPILIPRLELTFDAGREEFESRLLESVRRSAPGA